jgi:DNA-directed RNA polymerase subunit RPC12/RpoP
MKDTMMRSFKTIEFEKELKKPLKCPHCGQLISKGNYVCSHCQGQSGKEKIENAPHNKEIECPMCKTLNEKGNVTCISCGSNFVQLRMAKLKEASTRKTKK